MNGLTCPLWVKLAAVFFPLIFSPAIFALGKNAQAAYAFGIIFGAAFGIAIVLPFSRYRPPSRDVLR